METSPIRIDEQGYVRDSAGRRVCRVLPGLVLEFNDRDPLRRKTNGQPRIGLMELVKAVAGEGLSK